MKWVGRFFLLFSALMILLTALTLWLVIPDEKTLNAAFSGLGISLFAFYLYPIRHNIFETLRSNWGKKALMSFLVIFLVFCNLGLINYLSFKVPFYWDTTVNSNNTLSEQTQNVLNELKGSLHFDIYLRKKDQDRVIPLLKLYRYHRADLSYKLIDPELRPDIVKARKIKYYGTLVVSYGKKSVQIKEISEHAITKSILSLARSKPLVWFPSNHGEGDIDAKDSEGFSYLKKVMEESHIEVKKVTSLIGLGPHVKSVVILGPKENYSKEELALLDQYLKSNGSVFLALDPKMNFNFLSQWNKFLQKREIKFLPTFVIDKHSFVDGSKGSAPLVDRFNKNHYIGKYQAGGLFFPLAMGVETTASQIIAKSSPHPHSWGETNGAEFIDDKVEFTEGKDIQGPLTIAAQWQGKGRLVVVGNSTFVRNSFQNYPQQFLLFQNSLDWLSRREFLLSASRPQIRGERPVFSAPQLSLFRTVSIILAPLFLFSWAFMLTYRRATL